MTDNKREGHQEKQRGRKGREICETNITGETLGVKGGSAGHHVKIHSH